MLLHDVARLRIDRDRAARAFPRHALHRRDQRVAVGIAAGLLQRLIDQVHAVIGAERNEIGTEIVGLCSKAATYALLSAELCAAEYDPGRDHAEHLIAHVVEIVVVGEIAGTDDLDARIAEPALGELLGEDRAPAVPGK